MEVWALLIYEARYLPPAYGELEFPGTCVGISLVFLLFFWLFRSINSSIWLLVLATLSNIFLGLFGIIEITIVFFRLNSWVRLVNLYNLLVIDIIFV